MRLILVRHAETAWNAEGRHQGQTFDIPLSEAGRAQAAALAQRFQDLDIARAAASPLLRARETAELALGTRGAMLDYDLDLREISHGTWEGKTLTEIQAEDGETLRAWRERPEATRLPGGETLAEVEARAWAALERATAGLAGEEVLLLVTHDGVNRVLLCRILGLPLSQVWRFRQAPTCLNLVEGPDLQKLQVVRLNDASHLNPLFGEAVHRRL